MPRFEIVGIGRETGKKRVRIYDGIDQEAAIMSASSDGTIVEIGKIKQVPDDPPSEDQLSYAKDLDIFVPKGATKWEVRDMISCCVDHDKPATDRHKSFARMYQIEYTDYVGKKRLFATIFAALKNPSRIIEMISWFVYRVYRELVNGVDDAPISGPDDPIIEEIALNLVDDPLVIKSIRKYGGAELIWFGEWTDPDGNVRNGGSNRTLAYKRASTLLREKLKEKISRREMSKDIRKDGYVYRHISIDIPDRRMNEDSITDNQMEYIKTLAPDFKIKDGIESLGKWQASVIITQIKKKQDDLKYDIAKGKKGGTLKKLLWLIVIIIAIYYFAKSR